MGGGGSATIRGLRPGCRWRSLREQPPPRVRRVAVAHEADRVPRPGREIGGGRPDGAPGGRIDVVFTSRSTTVDGGVTDAAGASATAYMVANTSRRTPSRPSGQNPRTRTALARPSRAVPRRTPAPGDQPRRGWSSSWTWSAARIRTSSTACAERQVVPPPRGRHGHAVAHASAGPLTPAWPRSPARTRPR